MNLIVLLHLHPNIACITSMDADHLDIYGTSAAIEESFVEFASKIEDKNNLFITKDLPLEGNNCAVNEHAVYKAFNVRVKEMEVMFLMFKHHLVMQDFGLPGSIIL
jgi:UDP-N-acetylmuramate--alanine ligase